MGIRALVLFSVCATAVPPPTPSLRHANYLAIVPGAGGIPVHLACEAHGNYPDAARWQLLVGEGEVVDEGLVALGSQQDIHLDASRPRLHVLAVDSGWNLARVTVDRATWGLVCRDDLPLSIVGEAHLFAWHPGGEAALTVSSSVTGEGLRLIVRTLDGQVLLDQSGDFDDPAGLSIPASPAARVLAVEVARCEQPRLALDDVELRLGGGLAPYLATSPEAAEALGRRWEQWSRQPSR